MYTRFIVDKRTYVCSFIILICLYIYLLFLTENADTAVNILTANIIVISIVVHVQTVVIRLTTFFKEGDIFSLKLIFHMALID